MKLSRLMRVLVLGLKPQQMAMMKAEFPSLDLRFMDGGSPATQVKGKADTVDAVVSTRFVDHGALELVKRRDNYTHLPGGMDMLRAHLRALEQIGSP